MNTGDGISFMSFQWSRSYVDGASMSSFSNSTTEATSLIKEVSPLTFII